MESKIYNQDGLVSLNDEVIATIACKATMKNYGIVGLAAKNTKEGIFELLGVENMTQGVKVKNLGKSHIRIQLHVIVEYGTRIPVIIGNLIQSIKYEVESRTGLILDSVDVFIEGIQA